MAEMILFHYRPAESLLHRSDVRIKIVFLIIYSILTFRLSGAGMISHSAVILAAFLSTQPAGKSAGISQKTRYIKEGRLFLFMGLMIFLTRTVSTSSSPGVIDGFSAAGRFFSVVLLGMIFTSTTSPAAIHSAVYLLIKPFGSAAAGKASTQVTLTISFIPRILDSYLELKEARQTRFAEGIRNPFKRAGSLIIPLFARILEMAEDTALAMESRCYTDDRSFTPLKPTGNDIVLIAIAAPCALLSTAFGLIWPSLL